MSIFNDGSSVAPPRRCSMCGALEHGSLACPTTYPMTAPDESLDALREAEKTARAALRQFFDDCDYTGPFSEPDDLSGAYRAAVEARVRAEVAAEGPAAAPVEEMYETIATQLGRIYDVALVHARAAAYGCGYAIAVHGSELRDLDLIAVPWTDAATDAATVAEAIRKMTGGTFGQHPVDELSHGRLAWSIHLNNEHTLGNFKPVLPYIDLSVMPRAALTEAGKDRS